ncbi:MAG: hypothetical protein GX957_07335 [Clostridiaceae bacterium]|nr:hypothetical protein [Clostridiaceae bacterium]
MKKKIITLIVASGLLFVLAVVFIQNNSASKEMQVADDEIRLEIQLDVEEDIGLFIIDREVGGNDFSGGLSNADKSLLKHDELLICNYWIGYTR